MTQLHPPQGEDARGTAESGEGATPTPPVRDIPQATVTRLATYLRVLGAFAEAGTLIVSSEELAAAAGVGSAKLRKDLSFLGPNGVRGVGYDVLRLQSRIEAALGLDRGHRVVLVGVGSLGRALARYPGFDRRGFTMAGLFDSDPDVVGTRVAISSCVTSTISRTEPVNSARPSVSSPPPTRQRSRCAIGSCSQECAAS